MSVPIATPATSSSPAIASPAFELDFWQRLDGYLEPDDARIMRASLLGLSPAFCQAQLRGMNRGQTLLMRACAQDRVRCAKELLAHSDPNQQGANAFTALMLAALYGSERCLSVLLPVSDLELRDHNGMTALMLAALHNHHTCVRRLLDAGASVQPSPQGVSPLMLAIQSKDNVQALLAAGDDPRAVDNRGRTALFQAVRSGQLEVLQILLPHSDLLARSPAGEDLFDAVLRSVKAPRWKNARTWLCADLLCGWMNVDAPRLRTALEKAPDGSMPRAMALLERHLLEEADPAAATPPSLQSTGDSIPQANPTLPSTPLAAHGVKHSTRRL